MNFKTLFTSVVITAFVFVSCDKKITPKEDKSINNTNNIEKIEAPEGMVWVASKTFLMGAKNDDKFAKPREKPAHNVAVDGFFIDVHEVTNKQFKKFVDETKYVTVAERPIDWDEIKKDLPAGTPKPADSVLQPGSLIFNKEIAVVDSRNNNAQWWIWKIGANWKHPEGPGSSIEGNDNYPVVHIAQEDALAYCKWSNSRLPTEAEWESAAQGKFEDNIYSWGNKYEDLYANANTWQGKFPTENVTEDRFEYISPVKSYPANRIGLYDMAGNVWEMTSDLFNVNYYQTIDPTVVSNNPKGADKSYTPSNPYQAEFVMKGGSFLCNESHSTGFRISARMGMEPNSASDHIGFRTVITKEMLIK
jgi:formylglycine-generating enzyme required for sulfatase activity